MIRSNLNKSHETGQIESYNFVLLRQLLENISSFLGVSGSFNYPLSVVNIEKPEEIVQLINEQSHKESPAYSKAIAESVENTLSYPFKITGEKIIQIVFISIIALAIVGYLIYSIVKTVKTQLMVNGYLDCEENNPSAIIKEDVPFKEKEVPQDPFG